MWIFFFLGVCFRKRMLLFWKVARFSRRLLIPWLVVRLLLARWLAWKGTWQPERKNTDGNLHEGPSLCLLFAMQFGPVSKHLPHLPPPVIFLTLSNKLTLSRLLHFLRPGRSNNQPLYRDVVVFVVCCPPFPSFIGFHPVLTRWPPVLSEKRHVGSVTNSRTSKRKAVERHAGLCLAKLSAPA